MLIGCCHCNEDVPPPSDSFPPSVSASASSSGVVVVTRTGCSPNDERCLGNTAPAVYGITVASAPGTKFGCYPYYIGGFALFLNNTNPANCWSYNSAERAKILPSAFPCNDTTTPRWGLAISVLSGTVRVTVSCSALVSGILSNLGSWRFTAAGPKINCVSSFSLTKTSTDTLGYPFPPTISVGPL